MSYRRDVQVDDQVHLPLETTYNSSIDGVVDEVYSNRINFKYPPEWNTSNVNEKIIGIRNINIKRKHKTLNFILYVRKYKKETFDEGFTESKVAYLIDLMDRLLDNLPDVFWNYINISTKKSLKEEINEKSQNTYHKYYYRLDRIEKIDVMKSVLKYNELYMFMRYALESKEIEDINDELNNSEGIENQIEIRLANMKADEINVFRIPINITIDENDTWNDIRNKLIKCINRMNLYKYMHDEIFKYYSSSPDELVNKINQLNSIRDDYDLMIWQFKDIIGYDIPFYITSEDVDIFNYSYKQMKQLVFEKSDDDYYCDYLITPNNDESYNSAYKWNNDDDKTDYGYPYIFNEGDVSFDSKCFVFDLDTRNFLNIGSSKNQNPIKYICKYHRNLYFHNIRTDIDCRIAASFASQSNHNIIGKTNETFENIKYYKINDNGDSFWIECYDNDDINIPINFNDDVVLTMDLVFLQNRKLLYS